MMHPIEQQIPGLFSAISALSKSSQRKTFFRLAKESCLTIPDLEPELIAIVETASKTLEIDQPSFVWLKEYYDQTDKTYLDLFDNEPPKPGWEIWFCKSHLANGLIAILSGDSLRNAADAFYELSFSTSDDSAMAEHIKECLDQAACQQ